MSYKQYQTISSFLPDMEVHFRDLSTFNFLLARSLNSDIKISESVSYSPGPQPLLNFSCFSDCSRHISLNTHLATWIEISSKYLKVLGAGSASPGPTLK